MEKLGEVTAWRDSTLFSEAERLALEYAERITYTDRKVDDALVEDLKKHFTEAQIVELTAAVAEEWQPGGTAAQRAARVRQYLEDAFHRLDGHSSERTASAIAALARPAGDAN